MDKKIKKATVFFYEPVYVKGFGSVVGKKEKESWLGDWFDIAFDEDLWGEKSWEKCERKMVLKAVEVALAKAGINENETDYLIGGDLLNQIISASYSARELGIPFFGIYGACSTMAESMMLGAMLIDGGFAKNIACATSSHFATAERQFRNPLELGTPKTPTAQWTVVGAGASILSKQGEKFYPKITYATTGRVLDFGIKDANNMGAAMAPAAAETIMIHLEETGRDISYYDKVVTGDLGKLGAGILFDLLNEEGIKACDNYFDCGIEIYKENDNMNCGGSGCGCGGSVLNGYFIKNMIEGVFKRILFVATGALHSPTSTGQGESIPAIAHAVAIETE